MDTDKDIIIMIPKHKPSKHGIDLVLNKKRYDQNIQTKYEISVEE